MEGHRLIIKRKIPRGRERLVAVFVGGLAVTGLIMLGQLKTTLSARALVSVKSDLTNMRTQFGAVDSAVPADTAVDKLKKLIQDASVKPE